MLAFTFPGQGSQRSGMGHAWVEHPSWEVAAEASEIAGRDLTGLLLDAPMEELTLTANAQLATFVMSLVVLDAVERLGLFPAACAGHSLGEYTALVASGALSLSDGTRLVLERGDAMQEAADERPGTMAALIGIADDDAEAACQRAEDEVWVANYNAPGQVVIAGTVEGVAKATDRAKELGARKVLPIPVSGAFHTQLMLPARTRLRQTLEAVTFHSPEVPVVANVDARVHTDPGEWPGLLSAQLCSPVRWRQSLEALSGRGVTVAGRVGPRRGTDRHGPTHHSRRAWRGRGRPRRSGQADGHRGRYRRVDGVLPGPPGGAPLHVRAGHREPGSGGVRARCPAGRLGEHGPGRGHGRPGQRRRASSPAQCWPWVTGWARWA